VALIALGRVRGGSAARRSGSGGFKEIEAATAYEAQFVPALFRPWAPMVADLARIKAGDRVLDIACGTGVLAREAAARTGAKESCSWP